MSNEESAMKWQRNQSRTPVWLGLAILLLLALLAACTGQPDPPAAERNGLSPDDITETDWALVALGHPDDLQPAREGWSYPTLTFDAELARGTTGCNDYAADYTRDGMALIFGEVEQTAQDCPTAAALEQENRFTALLADVRHFSLTDDRLMLAASDGVLLFEADTSDAEQVTATVTPAAEQPTTTALPTAATPEATATATPLPTPGASITPAPSSQTYLWPAALPEPLAIVSGESYADPTGFVLTLTDATGGQLYAQIGGGAHAQFTGDPRPGAQPVTIRGQAGYEFTTGAGWSLYWVEDGTPYSIISGIPREMAFAVADGLEPVDLTTWQQRLTTVSTPTISR
jgi:heat shock protein HslJ